MPTTLCLAERTLEDRSTPKPNQRTLTGVHSRNWSTKGGSEARRAMGLYSRTLSTAAHTSSAPGSGGCSPLQKDRTNQARSHRSGSLRRLLASVLAHLPNTTCKIGFVQDCIFE